MQLSKNDYRLFEQLVSLSQAQLHKLMSQFLRRKYNDIIITPSYIVAKGNIPIALVAHMDTVFKSPVEELYYDQEKKVFWSPQGLGADDRAGVFAILQILKSGLRPSIILTTDEEKGGIGASQLALDMPKYPFSELKYLIELDRRDHKDAVFYDCISEDFQTYIESFGFIKAQGSFSDISFLMSEWQICGVNLSVGYQNEHCYNEILNIQHLFNTVNKVIKMLQENDIPNFIYKQKPIYNWRVPIQTYDTFEVQCSLCKRYFDDFETIPVKSSEHTTKFYCPDCVVYNVEWCHRCGEAYEITGTNQKNLCQDCMEAKGGTDKGTI